MTTRIIFIYINLLLIIYNSNGFIVDDYAAARQNVKEFDGNENFKNLKSHLAVIEITYETGKKLVNGFVNQNSVSILNDFVPKDIRLSILSIRYIYNNNSITLSDFNYEKKTFGNEVFFSIMSSNKQDIKKIDSNIFVNRSFLSNISGDMHSYSRDQLNDHLKTLKLGSLKDFFDCYIEFNNTFKFNSIELSDKWYIFGKVNGSNQNELIPTSYISNNFSLNTINRVNRVGYYNRGAIFLSLNEERFNNDDVGSYLLYLPKHKGVKQLKIFGQITNVRLTKDNVQILSIYAFKHNVKFDTCYNYHKIESSQIEDGYTLTPVSSPSSKVEEDKQQELTQSESNDSGILQETSDEMPITKKLKLDVEDKVQILCENINVLGEHIIKDLIIEVTKVELMPPVAENYGIYHIQGTYAYKNKISNFVQCNKGDINTDFNDYLVDDKGIKFFYTHK